MQVFIDSPDSLLAGFLSGDKTGRLVFITGSSGSGKTRVCLALAEHAKAMGIHAAGLVSPAVFKDNQKTGIDLLNLGSGVQRHLAILRGESSTGQITVDWHFDDKVLNWGNTVLERLGTCELLILDELGPLELERGVGLTNGIGLITARGYRLACIVVRPSLLKTAQALWPWGSPQCPYQPIIRGADMIHVRNLTVSFANQAVLQDVSLDVQRGECLVVTGPSGCGKSTLARVLTGLIPQVIPAEISGTVRVAGLDVFAHSPAEISASVGTVFQDPSSHLFHLKVADEVAFGPQNLGLPEDEIHRRVLWAMETLGLVDLAERKPSDLSGGQKQRLAIASALAMQPSVLVLDEPTASLDVPGTRSVVAALEELRKDFGLTIVMMEHRLAEIRNLADRVLVLDQGRAIASGEFNRVLGDHKLLQRYGLRRPTEEPMTAWKDLLSQNGKHPEGVHPLLEVKNVSAGYRGQAVVELVNLDIYPGEFIALVGDNGAGKSTLALVIAGLLKPLQGQVRFQGRSRPRPGLDISLLFQNPADQLFTDSVEEEVAFGPRNLRCYEPAWAEQVLEHADLACLRTRKPLSLSVGQQQRTALASCLSLRPRLVILDEPTLGQDWGHLQQLMDFIQALNQQGTAILLITHDYKLVYRYAQRVILMNAGRIALDGHNTLAGLKNMPTTTLPQVKYVTP